MAVFAEVPSGLDWAQRSALCKGVCWASLPDPVSHPGCRRLCCSRIPDLVMWDASI